MKEFLCMFQEIVSVTRDSGTGEKVHDRAGMSLTPVYNLFVSNARPAGRTTGT